MMERVLLLFGLAALATSFTIPVPPKVHEVYENGEDENPILNPGSDANLFEGDILIPAGRNALIDKRYRWKFPIPYILGDDLDLNAKGCVHQAFEMYRLKSCIDFKPYEGEKTYIKFEKRGGCFSSVGDQQNGQILSLGSGCDHKAVIEHELLHALGFYHEQSRTDRDDYVDIWLDEVTPGLQHNFNKYNDDYITDQNTAYDYESVMHYRPFSFNKNESIPTITTKIPEFYNIIGQYLDFSKMDVLRLNRMYNCSGPLTLLDQCAFEYASICGMIQATSDDADWVHTKSSVGAEDHTLLGKCRADSDHTWKIAHVPMEVGAKFRYAFQAVRGDPSASAGGIYIDDISLSETRCPNAVWRIQNFSKIMETADTNTVIDSPRFYSPEGYGYGVRIMPLSSYTDYTGHYTGLYFHLASGDNDAVMKWPAVNRQATLVVMDQDPDIKLRMSTARSLTTNMMMTSDGKFFWDNPSKVGKYDPSCGCYRGESWGWSNFVKHFDLRRRNYLKNDDLIIFIDFDDITSLINTEVPIEPKE
ncbi:meprin A, alpha (PABA peptide hydrolase), tandem duplicate 1 isoform X2 [Sander lucioperca]|uniref:meprin A, alpha (PABA peptide hydrolase), tandem duplicate 1 isoform X2 n=1 Tax=Sander lucioperca TaxID=283035 RepID=UPI00125DE967|nr:meprin A, alpha (PABA peptide hydrolase), tandem duplicate 1 isoform X2 [Sander lucioperca]